MAPPGGQECRHGQCRELLYSPGRRFKAQDVLDLRDHVLVHLVGEMADGQEEVLHFHVGGVTVEDGITRHHSHVLLVHPPGLVIHTVQSELDLGGRGAGLL